MCPCSVLRICFIRYVIACVKYLKNRCFLQPLRLNNIVKMNLEQKQGKAKEIFLLLFTVFLSHGSRIKYNFRYWLPNGVSALRSFFFSFFILSLFLIVFCLADVIYVYNLLMTNMTVPTDINQNCENFQ